MFTFLMSVELVSIF
jgi:vacuolar protein sorting-associated protein 8